jgi:hypothetical protein
MNDPAQRRGRGRPPKLRQCVTCTAMKPSRAFPTSTATECRDCRRGDAGTDPVVVGSLDFDRSAEGQNGDIFSTLGGISEDMRDRFKEAAGLAATNAKIAALVPPIPHCECCYEHRHVGRDTYGGVMTVCARCDYQLRATGQCHLHHSRLVYPELAQPAAVPTPLEIEM